MVKLGLGPDPSPLCPTSINCQAQRKQASEHLVRGGHVVTNTPFPPVSTILGIGRCWASTPTLPRSAPSSLTLPRTSATSSVEWVNLSEVFRVPADLGIRVFRSSVSDLGACQVVSGAGIRSVRDRMVAERMRSVPFEVAVSFLPLPPVAATLLVSLFSEISSQNGLRFLPILLYGRRWSWCQ
jgi:hypothetical protein